jgi:hypothetical protein
VRYHGVFAARSSWRDLVTPEHPAGAPRNKPKPCPAAGTDSPTATPSAAPASPSVPAKRAQRDAAPSPATVPSAGAPSALPTAPTVAPPLASVVLGAVLGVLVDLTTITVKHWSRLLDGALLASSSYVDWAVLLQRTFGFDALRCPKCDHRMRVISTITEPSAVKRILNHLGVRAEPLPRAPARDPTGQTDFDFDAA